MGITLKARSSHFCSLIKSSVFTDASGKEVTQEKGTMHALDLLQSIKQDGGNVYLIGNGGSAAVASHMNTDLCNVGGVRSMTLHDSSMLTCFSNDYGYEHAFSRRIEALARKGDLLIAISSSGQSKNIINAALSMKSKKASVITLTGFANNNPLRSLGDLNYWVKSHEYGMVEVAHLFTLHYWTDCMASQNESAKELLGVVN